MTQYIALIRGINVGGKNKVSMLELKLSFERAGFLGVVTYINSGNVIFTSGIDDLTTLVRMCEQILSEQFTVSTQVAIIPVTEFREAVRHAPSWWSEDPACRHNALFVIAPAHAATVLEEMGELKPAYEKRAHHGSVIFWSAQIEHISRTRWSRIIGTQAYRSVTIRNANTVAKLVALTS